MDAIASPHDAFFRESFGRREIAQDFMRHQLPADLLAELDLATLERTRCANGFPMPIPRPC